MKYVPLLFLLFASVAFAADEPVKTNSGDAAQNRAFRVAVAIQNSKDYSMAAEKWDSYLKKYPQATNALQARNNRGICNYQIGQYDKAIQDLTAVLKIEKNLTNRETALFIVAMSYKNLSDQNSSNLESAKVHFRTLFKEYPNTRFYLSAALGLGDVYNTMGESDLALKMYRIVYTRFPLEKQGASAYLEAGKVLYAQKAFAECANLMKEFRTKQKSSPRRFEAASLAGDALFSSQNYEQAQQEYAIVSDTKAQEIENTSLIEHALYNRGVCFIYLKKYDMVIKVFSELTTRFPQSKYIPSAELSMADALQLLSKPEESKEHYLKAANYPKTVSIANLNLAKLYFKENDLKNAMERINQMPAASFKAFKGMPEQQLATVRSACMCRAQIYGHSPDTENKKTAIKFCDEIIAIWEKDPEALWATLYSAQLQSELGNYSDCITRCRQILSQESWSKSVNALEAQILLANSLFITQQYKEAQLQYDALFKNNPTNTKRYEWLISEAKSLDKQEKPEDVIQILASELKNIATPSVRANALRYLGKAYLDVENVPNAKTILLQFQKEFPENANMYEVLFYLGKVYRTENNVPKAIEAFQKILDDFPKCAVESKATLELSQLKSLSGEVDKSLESFDKVIAQSKDEASRSQAIIESAAILYQNERLEQAIVRATLFINDYPENERIIDAYYLRALSKNKQAKYEEATKDCLQALTIATQKDILDKYEIKLRYTLLHSLAQSKDSVDQTIEEFDKFQVAKKRLNAVVSEEDTILYLYANQLFNTKKLDCGKASYETVFTQFPKSKYHFNCALMLGQMSMESKDFDVAKNYLTQAVAGTDSVSSIRAANKLGYIYLDSQDYQSAYQYFDNAVQIYDSNPQLQEDESVTNVVLDSRFQKAEVRMLQGKLVEALSLYEKLTTILETNRALAYLHASQCAYKTEKYNVATDFLNKALDENDNLKEELAKSSKQFEPALQEQRALLLFNTGKENKAIALFKRIVKENDNLDIQQTDKTVLRAVAQSWYYLGVYQMQHQKNREAVAVFYNVIYGDYPFPELKADACYEAGRCYENLEQTDNATKMYKELLKICPTSNKADFAKSRLNMK